MEGWQAERGQRAWCRESPTGPVDDKRAWRREASGPRGSGERKLEWVIPTPQRLCWADEWEEEYLGIVDEIPRFGGVPRSVVRLVGKGYPSRSPEGSGDLEPQPPLRGSVGGWGSRSRIPSTPSGLAQALSGRLRAENERADRVGPWGPCIPWSRIGPKRARAW